MNSDTLLKQLNMFLTEANWFNANKNGDIDIIKIFIENNFDINHQNCSGSTALITATQFNNVNIIKLLLDAGANVNDKNEYNCTALIWAAQFKNTDILKLLLDAGANINHQHCNGRTALMTVSQINNIKLLLDAGADMSIKDIYGNTARMIAKEEGYHDIVELLNTYEKECSNTTEEYSSIMFSVKTSDLDSVIKSAINSGAKPNFKIYDSDTALIIAKHFKQSNLKF